jgi:hypothetical protein
MSRCYWNDINGCNYFFNTDLPQTDISSGATFYEIPGSAVAEFRRLAASLFTCTHARSKIVRVRLTDVLMLQLDKWSPVQINIPIFEMVNRGIALPQKLEGSVGPLQAMECEAPLW